MVSWQLIPGIPSLFKEFNTAFPNRSKVSDGTIGDAKHSQESSDHNPDETGKTPYEDSDNTNEVHAADVDSTLNLAGWNMQKCVDIIVERHRTGKDVRLQNVIYNRKIWSRTWGWTAKPYTGASAHTEHAHFSFRYGSGNGSGNPENIVTPWGILAEMEKDMIVEGFSDAAKDQISVAAINGVLAYNRGGVPGIPGTDNPTVLNAIAYISHTVQRLDGEVADLKTILATILSKLG